MKTTNKPTPKPLDLDIKNIQFKIARAIKEPVKTLEELELFLKKWWCRRYSKPYKCTEINEYTLEELIHEYFDIYYHENPEELKKLLYGESKDAKTDEKWLKQMMGGQYIDKGQQEKALKGMEKEIEDATKEYDPEELHVDFEEFE